MIANSVSKAIAGLFCYNLIMDNFLQQLRQYYSADPTPGNLSQLNTGLSRSGQETLLPIQHLRWLFNSIVDLLNGVEISENHRGDMESVIAVGSYRKDFHDPELIIDIRAYNVFGDHFVNSHLVISVDPLYLDEDDSHEISIYPDDLMYLSWQCRDSNGELEQTEIPLHSPIAYDPQAMLDLAITHWEDLQNRLPKRRYRRNADSSFRELEQRFAATGDIEDRLRYYQARRRMGLCHIHDQAWGECFCFRGPSQAGDEGRRINNNMLISLIAADLPRDASIYEIAGWAKDRAQRQELFSTYNYSDPRIWRNENDNHRVNVDTIDVSAAIYRFTDEDGQIYFTNLQELPDWHALVRLVERSQPRQYAKKRPDPQDALDYLQDVVEEHLGEIQQPLVAVHDGNPVETQFHIHLLDPEGNPGVRIAVVRYSIETLEFNQAQLGFNFYSDTFHGL